MISVLLSWGKKSRDCELETSLSDPIQTRSLHADVAPKIANITKRASSLGSPPSTKSSFKQDCMNKVKNNMISHQHVEMLSTKTTSELMYIKEIRFNFRRYTEAVYCTEVVDFWEMVTAYRTILDEQLMLEEAHKIAFSCLVEGCKREINTNSRLRKKIFHEIKTGKVDSTLFDDVMKEIQSEDGVLGDAFKRYKELVIRIDKESNSVNT
ncbi:regulator of G-protein signaling [Acrasis kona]|uniref:Regulator of G-protein signaling n=1 Tax=Acrasis kona TaxID=1008807 RepID=A0AAW2YQ97_9EUKA